MLSVPQHYPGHKRRGRCRRAISDRPTPLPRALFARGRSPFVSPSLFHPLTPLFPLDASHSPVTPLFPLDTQYRGVHPPSNMTKQSISEFSPRLSTTRQNENVGAPTFVISARPSSLRVSAFSAPLRYFFPSLFRCSPPATSHSPLATKSNHSRTSEKISRKSNYSRTYAKTGGWGSFFCAPSPFFLSALCVLCGKTSFPR